MGRYYENCFVFVVNNDLLSNCWLCRCESKTRGAQSKQLVHHNIGRLSLARVIFWCRNDFETYSAAKEYTSTHHLRVVHIGLSGTDTYGHKKQYDYYLYQAHLADKIIAGLWQIVHASSFYRDNTTVIITTDHGRGSSDNSWYNDGMLVRGSSQTWAALIGNGIKSIGESSQAIQLYQKQVAGTMGYFLNATSYKNYSFPLSYFTPLNNRQSGLTDF